MPTKPTGQKTDVFSVEELAQFLRIGRTSTFKLLATGQIPSLRIGRRRLVRRLDAERFVAERVEVEG